MFFELCDWLRKNGNLFQLEKSGEAKLRAHGHGSEWEDIEQISSKELLFVDVAGIDDQLLSPQNEEGDLEADDDLFQSEDDDEMILAQPIGELPTNDIPDNFEQEEDFIQDTLFPTNDAMQVDHPPTTDLIFFDQETGLADLLFTELKSLLVSDETLVSRRRTRSVQDPSHSSRFRIGEPFTRDPPSGTRGDYQAAGLDFGDALYHIDQWPSDFGEWIHVLEKGCKKVHRDAVQPLDRDYNQIFEYFAERGFVFKLLIVRQSVGNDQITVFDAHEDKPEFENGVGFLSFSTPFWTVLVRNGTSEVDDDNIRFVRYCRGLPPDDKRRISKFMGGFGISQSLFLDFVTGTVLPEGTVPPEASIHSLCPKLAFFYCTPGSALAFGKGVKHGTIIPRSVVHRHLFILTQMVEYRL